MCLRFNITTSIQSKEININCGYTIRVNISDTNISYEQTKLLLSFKDKQIDGKIFDGRQIFTTGYLCYLKLYSDDNGVYCDIYFPPKTEDLNDTKIIVNNIPNYDIVCPIFISRECDENSIIYELNKSITLTAKTWKLVDVSLTSFDRFFLLKMCETNPILLNVYNPDPYIQYQNQICSTIYCYVENNTDNETKINVYLYNDTSCILKEGTVFSTIKTKYLQYASKIICINDE